MGVLLHALPTRRPQRPPDYETLRALGKESGKEVSHPVAFLGRKVRLPACQDARLAWGVSVTFCGRFQEGRRKRKNQPRRCSSRALSFPREPWRRKYGPVAFFHTGLPDFSETCPGIHRRSRTCSYRGRRLVVR